jgi:hypothetical protein
MGPARSWSRQRPALRKSSRALLSTTKPGRRGRHPLRHQSLTLSRGVDREAEIAGVGGAARDVAQVDLADVGRRLAPREQPEMGQAPLRERVMCEDDGAPLTLKSYHPEQARRSG